MIPKIFVNGCECEFTEDLSIETYLQGPISGCSAKCRKCGTLIECKTDDAFNLHRDKMWDTAMITAIDGTKAIVEFVSTEIPV